MKVDFALILTVLSAVTGSIWLLDRLFFAKSRSLMVKDGEEVAEPAIVDYARSLFPVLFFVLVLRSFVAEPFRHDRGLGEASAKWSRSNRRAAAWIRSPLSLRVTSPATGPKPIRNSPSCASVASRRRGFWGA